MHALVATLFFALSPNPVAHVVVYPDRAQVTRAQTVSCESRTLVTFAAIPPSADPHSIRARVSAGAVEGLRWEERTRREAFASEVIELDGKLRKLDMERAQLADSGARGGARRALSDRYQNVAATLINREMVDASANSKSWSGALELALKTRLGVADAEVDRAAQLRDVDRRREELVRKRNRLSQASARREYVAEVLVACPAGQSARLELTYLVGGASWEPAYEAHADEGRGELELLTWATVRQATGEDWRGVDVILSTAIPRQNATPPEISPLRVYTEERKAPKKVLVRRDEDVRHAEAPGGGEDMDGEKQKDLGGARGPGLRPASQGLSVQLVVPEAADVTGDGSPSRLLVARTKMKAQFAYRAAPKLAPFVFRVADVVNTAPFPLMPGMMDVFRRGGLTGRHPQERVAQGEKFLLTFGIEEGIKVKRSVIEEIARDKGLLSSAKKFRYAYRFELESFLDGLQSVEVSDHVPVSELDDVKVQIDPRVTSGYQLEPTDGIVTWKWNLAQGEKKTFDLAFVVEVPGSYDMGGM